MILRSKRKKIRSNEKTPACSFITFEIEIQLGLNYKPTFAQGLAEGD